MAIQPAHRGRGGNSIASIGRLEDRRLRSTGIAASEFDMSNFACLGIFTHTEADARWTETPTVQSGPIRFSIPGAPNGMKINPDSGTMSWTPTEVQAGYNRLLVVGSNSEGMQKQKLNIQVEPEMPAGGWISDATSTGFTGMVDAAGHRC